MTEEDVCNILGKPGKPFFPDTKIIQIWANDDLPPWVPNDTQIAIYFDKIGQVDMKELMDTKRTWKERFAKYLP